MQKNTNACFNIFLLFVASTLSIYSQNLLNNGGFESGVGTGFFTNGAGYVLITAPFSGTTAPGNYAITNNPQPMNTANFVNSVDHTSGTGNMMVIDGNTIGGQQNFWEAGNGGSGVCGLTIGTTYTFSYWIQSVSTTVTNAATRANIGVQILNANSVTLVSGNNVAPLPAAGWQQVVYTFVPTAPCANIKLFNNNTNPVGNDFAFDDFSVTAPPLPLSLNYSFNSPTCPGTNNGNISGYGVGGVLPYSYSIVGSINTSNGNGIFNSLPAGTYTLTVTDATLATATQSNIVLIAPTDLTVSAGTTVCAGSPTTLTVSGSTTGYTWTASPADTTLTTPNSATPTVSPTQPTTYTVTSTTATPTSLINNGNFSSGNAGFTSDYTYLTVTTPVGAQKTYGIVTNSNTWFGGFSACTDHTSGSGNMMVGDGSTFNAGNDKFWCQTVPVIAGQNYTFSYWIQTVSTSNFANIDVLINSASVGISLAPAAACSWVQKTYTWNSGASTSAQICLYDRNTSSAGNDFAIDDISFTGPVSCNLQKTVTIAVNPKPVLSAGVTAQPTCAVSTGTITVSAPLGVNFEYSTNGTTYQSNPVFSGLVAASYNVTVRNIVTTCISNILNLTINSAVGSLPNVSGTTGVGPACTVKLIGNSTTIGVSISWNGPNLSANSPNPALATVSGTYTVTAFDPASGCSNSTTLNAVVPNSPTAPITTTTQPICSAALGSIVVTSPLGANLQYSINGSTYQTSTAFNGLSPSTYSVTVRNTVSNCTSPVTTVILSNSTGLAAPVASSPINLCQSQPAPSLTATALPGASLLWYGTFATGGTGSTTPTVPSLATLGTTSYYVSQIIGLCESPRTAISVNVSAAGGTISMFCDPTQTTAPNSVYFDWNNLVGPPYYNYSYSINGGPLVSGSTNISHLEVFGVLTNQCVELTITSVNGYPCVAPISNICCFCPVRTTPTFPTVPTAICAGSIAPILPLSSSEGISGTWSPLAVSNTVGGTYIFTPDRILFPCANGPVNKGISVTAAPNAGTLNGNQNICVGLTTLFSSTTSGGSWNSLTPAVATVNANSGSVTGVSAGTATVQYTVMGTAGCAGNNPSQTRTVTVTAAPNPGTLSGDQTICTGTTAPFSSNVSGGSWSSTNAAVATVNPSGLVTAISAGTTDIKYTVAGSGGCQPAATQRSVTVTAAPISGNLSGNQNICIGSTTTFVSTASGGSWTATNTAVATVNATTGVVTGVAAGTTPITYTVLATGGCSVNASQIRNVTVTAPPNTGTLSGTQTLCVGSTATYSSTVIGGTWSSSTPATATVNANNGLVTAIAAGTSNVVYTVPGTGGCSAVASPARILTVTAKVTPTFNAVAAICSGSTLPNLPTISTNGYTGSWSPAINNTATVTYTFTPTSGQCATTTTITIVINQKVTAVFDPVAVQCHNDPNVPILPLISRNGISGTWTPAAVSLATVGLNQMYTFQPNPGQCVTATVVTLSIDVLQVTIPNFPNRSYCYGTDLANIPLLDTTSPNGVEGTWSPSVISNTTTAIYTFTPNTVINQCAKIQRITVTIVPKTIPDFSAISFCLGTTAPVLVPISPNGVTGTWTPPAIDNTVVGTFPYVFSPTAGLCATSQTLNVAVTPPPIPSFQDIALCKGTAPPVLSSVSPNGISGSWIPVTIDNNLVALVWPASF